MSWWVSNYYAVSPVLLYSWIFWVLTSIVLHELAHGWTAIRMGDDTPIHTGHMTWNPLVHMGTTSLLLFALFGFCWGAMPINPSRMRGRYAHSLVALAGPLMNLLQFAVLLAASVAWVVWAKGAEEPLKGNLRIFLATGAMINLVGFLFNLVPVPPLDGSVILSEMSRGYRRLLSTEFGQVSAFIGMAVLFAAGGSRIWSFAISVTFSLIHLGESLFHQSPTRIF
jgi:Zn-dependent protease